MKNFEAIIIGAGQAGKPLATFLSGKGLRVAVIEKSFAGGSCINYGCTPTKIMLASAKAAHDARQAHRLGVDVKQVRVDFQKIIKRRDEIVHSWREGIVESFRNDENIEFIRGKASFEGPKKVKVTMQNNESILITADRIFVNTGTIPRIPEIDGIEEVPYLDAMNMMELNEVPEHLVVIGGGYIGLEFGQMFRRFGSEVSILQDDEQLLPREDRDIAELMEKILSSEGINIYTGTKVNRVSGRPGNIKLDYEHKGKSPTVQATHLMLATGTHAATGDLQLDLAGVEIDERAYIKTDDWLQTSTPGIYALGDVKGGPEFTHISYDDFRIVRDHLFSETGKSMNNRMIPYTLFTDPQLGRIGLNEKMARKQGKKYKMAKMNMENVSRGIETANTNGLLKVLTNKETGHILGASMLMPEGGEIMAILQVAMMGKLTYRDLMESPFTHPTYAESLNNLFMNLK